MEQGAAGQTARTRRSAWQDKALQRLHFSGHAEGAPGAAILKWALMKSLCRVFAAAFLLAGSWAVPSIAQTALSVRADALVRQLTMACPLARHDDMAAFKACEVALRKTDAIPFAASVLWGGDQPGMLFRKKTLTHFNSGIFQTLYLPLMMFTGKWSIGHDGQDNVDFIRVEAYFRNALPPGQYPYPFWHSAEKWNAYETMNRVTFHFDVQGMIFMATRGTDASDTTQGAPGQEAFGHVIPPAFDGKWQWTDPFGQRQPRAALFSSLFSLRNPIMDRLDQAYREFATQIREGACLGCHTPANPAGMRRLVLLQTPIHAAGEIDNVIRAVREGAMPLDDIGLRKDIGTAKRESILRSAEAFRDELDKARDWESLHGS